MESGTLYIVPTPIGNLGDMTLRGLETLRQAGLILAEDTRTTGKLLKHFEIDTPMRSYHMHNEHKVVAGIVKELEDGTDMALVSDAGTPGISDPGFLLVRECVRLGIPVTCLPGATALIPALVCSGFPTDRFVFEGFLPAKKGRQSRLQQLAQETRTLVLYESPHKLLKTLEQLAAHFGPEREAVVCRELSKMYEEIVRGTLAGISEHFKARAPKGELVIVIAGRS